MLVIAPQLYNTSVDVETGGQFNKPRAGRQSQPGYEDGAETFSIVGGLAPPPTTTQPDFEVHPLQSSVHVGMGGRFVRPRAGRHSQPGYEDGAETFSIVGGLAAPPTTTQPDFEVHPLQSSSRDLA